ncbi:unnamed protein product [Durusdinium trenchii]|uniref:Photosystem I assembly protein Ycf4 n=1 Tax=Durusdinium trenchii TaxID=1381693 RepID=A0ABP0QGG8_9DINO
MALPTVPSVRGKAQAVPDMFSSCFSLLQAFWIGLAGTGMYSFFKASTASPGLCQGQKGLSQQVLIVIRPSYQKALWSCNSLSRSAWAAIDARSTALRQAIILAQISLATQRPGDQEINVSLGGRLVIFTRFFLERGSSGCTSLAIWRNAVQKNALGLDFCLFFEDHQWPLRELARQLQG